MKQSAVAPFCAEYPRVGNERMLQGLVLALRDLLAHCTTLDLSIGAFTRKVFASCFSCDASKYVTQTQCAVADLTKTKSCHLISFVAVDARLIVSQVEVEEGPF